MRQVNYRKPKRLIVERLEAREVPARIVVTTTADVVDPADRKVSLREAISKANADSSPKPDTIVLPAGTYQITKPEFPNHPDENVGGDFDIRRPITIRGVGASRTFVDGSSMPRIFDLIGSIDVTFANLTIQNGGSMLDVADRNDGAGIQALSANITVKNTILTGNLAIKGGAINNETGNVTLIRSTIKVNSSSGDGGGINMGTGILTFDRSTIDGNSAANSGGGVNSGGNVELTRSIVSNNFAHKGAGGGISALSVTMDRSDIFSNSAKFAGGGIYATTLLTATRSEIRDNSGLTGGGISADTVNISKSSSVTGNAARLTFGVGLLEPRGGGILGAADIELKDSIVDGNTADDSGGGLLGLGTITATNCTISNNSANVSGGGIWGNTVTMHSCTINGNSSLTSDGGGLFTVTSNLDNVTLSGNTTGGSGGGIRTQTGILANVTVTKNVAHSYAGGIWSDSENNGSDPTKLVNSIVAQNSVDLNGSNPDVMSDFQSLGHNLIGDPSGAEGTPFTAAGDQVGTAAQPLNPHLGELANNGGPTQTCALLSGSTAIDGGDNDAVIAIKADQRGRRRIRDGNHDRKKIVDIGAFER